VRCGLDIAVDGRDDVCVPVNGSGGDVRVPDQEGRGDDADVTKNDIIGDVISVKVDDYFGDLTFVSRIVSQQLSMMVVMQEMTSVQMPRFPE
jgi:hypothetical protein